MTELEYRQPLVGSNNTTIDTHQTHLQFQQEAEEFHVTSDIRNKSTKIRSITTVTDP